MRVKYCIVKTCKNNLKTTPEKCFVLIPLNKEIRSKWFTALNIEDKTINTTKYYVCEDHFNLEEDAENWMFFKTIGTKLQIKKHVVPHKNILEIDVGHATSQISSSQKKRKVSNIAHLKEEGTVRRKLLFSEAQPSSSGTSQILPQSPGTPDKVSQMQYSVHSPSGLFSVQLNIDREVQTLYPIMNDASTNTLLKGIKNPIMYSSPSPLSSGSDTFSLCSDNSSPTLPSSSTTSSSMDDKTLFDTKMRNEGRKIDTIKKIETNSRFYLGLPQTEYFLIKVTLMNVDIRRMDLLIVLKKIRLNDSFVRLGIDFGIHQTTVTKSFHKSLPLVANKYKQLIYWPLANQIKKLLPVGFRLRYNKVQSIIDCFEIQIQTPTNAVHQAMTWSNYKKCNTAKYLVSCTPNGLINFVSCGYCGRTSDREILENSGYLNVLPPNSWVMADRGFKNTEGLLQTKNCSLIRPPSVIAEEKKSREEVMECKRIAALRIHVERVIRRIREFSILESHATVSTKLINNLDNIVYIVCGLVNMQGTLIK